MIYLIFLICHQVDSLDLQKSNIIRFKSQASQEDLVGADFNQLYHHSQIV